MNSAELLKIGERIYNLERYYNNLAGFGEGSRHAAGALPEGTVHLCPAPRGTSASWT